MGASPCSIFAVKPPCSLHRPGTSSMQTMCALGFVQSAFVCLLAHEAHGHRPPQESLTHHCSSRGSCGFTAGFSRWAPWPESSTTRDAPSSSPLRFFSLR
eukprot:scaffold20941_cov34-Tisochrysis_lutea.AAC.3